MPVDARRNNADGFRSTDKIGAQVKLDQLTAVAGFGMFPHCQTVTVHNGCQTVKRPNWVTLQPGQYLESHHWRGLSWRFQDADFHSLTVQHAVNACGGVCD
jgi:hypothetical protein